MDYYGVLGITKNATDLEIKKAFKRMAIHLLRSLRDDECVEEMFITVAEAYDVLSNDKLKAVYDQYGEDGLKKGVPSPDGFIPPYVYHGDFMRTYEEFFGTTSPYADLLDAMINPLPIYELPEGRGYKKQPEPLVRPIYLTLEEIYQGCIKKVKIKKQVLISAESGGQTELQEKILEVPIKPGMLQGVEIRFPQEGDQGPTVIPADVIFKVTDRPHELFTRDGADLIMNVHVCLLDALVGTTIHVKTPDYRTLRIPIHDIIHPNYQKIVPNEGMPIVDDPNLKGNLIMKFQIDFPTYLPRSSKNMIRKALDVCKVLATPGEADNINLRVMADKMMRMPYYERLPPAEPCQPIPVKPCKENDKTNFHF